MSKNSIVKNLIPILIIMLFLCGESLYAQCDSTNAIINSKIRFLGTWQPNGRPNYLESELDTISQDIQQFIDEVLPESVNITDSGIFNDDLKSNTEILDTTEVYLTYVHEGASWFNTLGFYTYDLDNPPDTYEDIDSMVVIFPNVTDPSVIKKGEKVYLGTFPPNTGIGYFLIARGWQNDTICIRNHIVFTDKRLNTFTAEEYQQHTVLLNYEEESKFLLGIEDQARPGGDMDFNDAVFYITGKIDTNGVAKLPVAVISGDTVLCDESDLATIRIDLSGTPPFKVIYNNGTEDIEISDITTNSYTFQTDVKDTLTLVSVEDAHGLGIVKGQAIIQLSSLEAGFVNNRILFCEGETETIAKVYFNGTPPYSLKYTEDGNPMEITGITEDTIELTIQTESEYILSEVQDKYCTVTLSEELDIVGVPSPTANLQNIDTAICEGTEINLPVELSGELPITLVYDINGVENTVVIEDDQDFFITVNQESIITLVQVFSGNCEGDVTGSASVSINGRPTVELVKPDIDCDTEEEVDLTLNFAGDGPFDYSYSISGNTVSGTTNGSEVVSLNVNQTFQLLSFNDQNCDGEVVDSLHTFKNFSTPEAVILTEQSIICGESEASILIEFKGVPPFEAVISNGVELDTIYTHQFNFEYLTGLEGTFEIISLKNEECVGFATGQALVERKDTPIIDIDFPEADCENTGSAFITLNFQGESPFTYEYNISGESFSSTTESNSAEIEIQINEVFELTGFSDVNCPGVVDPNKSTYYHYSKPIATFLTTNLAICEEGEEVSIEISLEGIKPIAFEISNGDFSEVITTDQSTYIFTTDQLGLFEIISISNDFCVGEAIGSALVEMKEKPTADFYAVTDNFCEGETGTLALDFTGEGPWKFTVVGENGEDTYNTSEEHFEFTVSDAGTYQITGFSDANCSGVVTNSVTVNTIPRPAATIEGGGEFCGEDQFATITFEFIGQFPFKFTYTDGEEEFQVTTEENMFSIDVTKSGTYQIVEFSDANCNGNFSGEAIVRNLGDELDGIIDAPETSCEGESIMLSFTELEDLTSVEWSTSGNGEIISHGTFNIEYIPAEGETGEIEFFVEASNECGTKTFSKTLIIIETPDADFSISPDELFTDSEIIFVAADGSYDEYEWDFGDGSTGSSSQVIHVYTQAGVYEVTLTVEVDGCKNESSKGVEVKSKNELYVPNVFNPNALNPENRVAKVYGTNISEEGFLFKIVNRWGNTMYQTNSFITANSSGWDGEEFNIGEEQSLSTFTYILRGHFKDGETFEQTGTITILQ